METASTVRRFQAAIQYSERNPEKRDCVTDRVLQTDTQDNIDRHRA